MSPRLVPTLALAAALLITGCAGTAGTPANGPTAGAPSAPLPRHATFAQIEAAVAEAMRSESSVTFRAESTITDRTYLYRGELRTADGSTAVRAFQETRGPTLPEPLTIAYLLIGDDHYIDTTPGFGLPRPWRRVGQGVRASIKGLTDDIRQLAQPSEALVDFGRSGTVAGTAPDVVDGVPAMRHDLRGGQLGREGAVWLDSANRVVRIEYRARSRPELPVPDLVYDYRYFGWSAPVQIDPPPPEQVWTSAEQS